MNRQEAISEFRRLKPEYEAAGVIIPGAKMFIPDDWVSGNLNLDEIAMAMDAAGTLSTDPNSALPTILTTAVDPDVYRVVFAPLQIAEIEPPHRKRFLSAFRYLIKRLEREVPEQIIALARTIQGGRAFEDGEEK